MAEMEDVAADALRRMHNAIHALAQPLTALSFVVDMALLKKSSPEDWKTALENAQTETRRAVAALEQLRSAAVALHGDEVLPWEPLQ